MPQCASEASSQRFANCAHDVAHAQANLYVTTVSRRGCALPHCIRSVSRDLDSVPRAAAVQQACTLVGMDIVQPMAHKGQGSAIGDVGSTGARLHTLMQVQGGRGAPAKAPRCAYSALHALTMSAISGLRPALSSEGGCSVYCDV